MKLDGRKLPALTSRAAFDAAAQGWWYDRDERGGVVRVKTPALSTARDFELRLSDTSAVGGAVPGASATLAVPTAQELGAGAPGTVAVDVTAGSRDATDVRVSLAAPAGWQVTPAAPIDRVPAAPPAASRSPSPPPRTPSPARPPSPRPPGTAPRAPTAPPPSGSRSG